ncbi:MAG: septum formation initiator family protein [Clostridiales bacterium]|nr:septum formation initiator family protein [Clostridiales bacterium]
MEVTEKTKKRLSLRWGWSSLVFAALAVLILLNFGHQYLRYLDALAQLHHYEEQLAQKETGIDNLAQEKELLNDSAYLETIARNLGMIKRGETLIQPFDSKVKAPQLDKNIDPSTMLD